MMDEEGCLATFKAEDIHTELVEEREEEEEATKEKPKNVHGRQTIFIILKREGL